MSPSLRSSAVLLALFAARLAAGSRPREEAAAPDLTLDGVAALLGGAERGSYLERARGELDDNEALLSALLKVVPHAEGERFAAPAVRFALHKHFVRQHGWHLKGLEPAGGKWNSSSPVQAVIFQRLPAAVRDLFESRLQHGGLRSREVAVLAATLEVLVHSEAQERLRGVMRMLNLKTSEPMTKIEALKVRDWYMTSFMLGKNPWTTGRLDLKTYVNDMPEMYPAWPKLLSMIDDINAASPTAGGAEDEVPFGKVQSMVDEVGHRFGPWQNQICADLKASLMELRDDGTGRVALSDFYKAGLEGKWQFQESAEYMQKLGSLDTSNPSSPRVIIPNWVNSPSNCLGTSETHDVCCISECEPLLAQLEGAIGAPTASPEAILQIVPKMPSATMPAGRQLPVLLTNRLQAIAAAHDGVVPLNGRLFAQWMHHAYPRECPFPHLAGSTKPVNVFAWEASHAELPIANQEAMQKLADRPRRASAPVLSAPWESEEELLVDVRHAAPVGAAVVHLGVAAAASCVALMGLTRTAVRAVRGGGATGGKAAMAHRAIVV